MGCETIFEGKSCECSNGDIVIFIIWTKDGKQFIRPLSCCGEGKVSAISISQIWQSMNENKEKIFDSKFKFDYLESHYGFKKIKLLSRKKQGSILAPDYIFDKEYKYQTFNLKQPAKVFIDQLNKEINKANLAIE